MSNFDVDDYQEFCTCVESKPTPATLFQTPEQRQALYEMLTLATAVAERADRLKKVAMYGREDVELQYTRHPGSDEVAQRLVALDSTQARILHSILGVSSEVGELVEAVIGSLYRGEIGGVPPELDLVNISEEFADIGWYMNTGLDAVGMQTSEAMSRNRQKLINRNRGEKFNAEGTNNRRLDEERAILEGEDGNGNGEGVGGNGNGVGGDGEGAGGKGNGVDGNGER